MEKKEIFSIFNKYFYEYKLSYEAFNRLFDLDKISYFLEYSENKLQGFVLFFENEIYLIAVMPEAGRKNLGSKLLKKAEEQIKRAGYQEIILGGGAFQGVPHKPASGINFFTKMGYKASWSSVNMSLEFNKIDLEEIEIPEVPENLTFKFLEKEEEKALLKAVREAQISWIEYFTDCKEPVLIVKDGNEVLGFAIVSPEGGRFFKTNKRGAIGCVGVIPSARNKGIGRYLVLESLKWLKGKCDSVELLYVALIEWYKRLGFSVTDYQWMGKKNL